MKAVSKITGHTIKGKLAEILCRLGKAEPIDESEEPIKEVKQKDQPKRVYKKKK